MSQSKMLFALLLAACVVNAAWAKPSTVERTADDVWVVRDDAGKCVPGSQGMTHQSAPGYQAKKILDLGGVPKEVWGKAAKVRLSAYFCVRDYSKQAAGKVNGLDEAIEIVVNGKVHRFPTKAGLPVYRDKTPMSKCFRWHDFSIPKGELRRGPNEIILRKAAAKKEKYDDYLYLGIDNSVSGGNSWAKFGDTTDWQQDKLTVPGGKGEYAVRVYLLTGKTNIEAAWLPAEGRTKDELKIIDYAGSHGEDTRVEWDPRKLDSVAPVIAVVEAAGGKPFDVFWLDEAGEPKKPPVKSKGARCEMKLMPPLPFVPSGLKLAKGVPVKQITLKACRNYHPLPRQVNIAPHMAQPKGAPANRSPSCTIEDGQITLANANLRCTFSARGKLRLTSLYNEPAAAEMVRDPDHSALFVVEVDEKRYAGSRDFECQSASGMLFSKGFNAKLLCKETGLEAKLSVWIDDSLRMALGLTNRGEKPVDLKVAFPHFSGLAIAQDPASDYYFFPWGGGIMSDASAIIRRGYGDHEAIYQVMDIYSPAHGAGLLVRCTDDDGRHKTLALRKYIPGETEINGERLYVRTGDEYKWSNSLPETKGIGLTYEYLRRTREPGKSFRPKDVAIEAHPGDWRVAMKRYADWCHKRWTFRPYPSRLTPITNMIAAGWGQGYLFRDGGYRTDIIRPMCDCIELMSWWEWSPLGPWSTPFDRLHEVLTEAKIKRWSSYFVKDPVTGKKMWNNQPGDYDGYNERFGGLPAFRKAVHTYRDLGSLVTLYTDPFRMDDASKIGRKHGKEWGVVLSDGKHSKAYEVWNPCHDCPEVRKWVAEAMKRVMKETDADGIRLDEYGHKGWACFSDLHKHTYEERGCSEWQRATSEATKMVRKAMDEAKPGSVLTTEHPGYDYMMQYLEGCITYDVTVQATPLRPMECNLQRFYFPECKAFELDHRRADLKHRKRLWNGVASFGRYYPANMYHILSENNDTFETRDCEPLIPTSAKLVYANRFRGGGKTMYMLYNATGHAFEGPALKMSVAAGQHVFDMLNCREVSHNKGVVRVFFLRDDVLCLAVLPDRLTVRRTGKTLEVAIRGDHAGCEVRVCDKEGRPLLSRAAVGDAIRFDLTQIAQTNMSPACVKLLKNGLLIDVAAVPAAR